LVSASPGLVDLPNGLSHAQAPDKALLRLGEAGARNQGGKNKGQRLGDFHGSTSWYVYFSK
jgi:hypothetical protein